MDKTGVVKIIDIVILLLIFSMLFVNIIQIVGHNKGIFLISAIINVHQNWNTLMLLDLSDQRTFAHINTINFGTFYGHEKCCQCFNEEKQANEFTLGDCNRQNIEDGCKLIPLQEAKDVDLWTEAYSYYNRTNYTYFELLRYFTELKDEKCDVNKGECECADNQTRACGLLDTLGHVLCWPKKYACPFNNFKKVKVDMFTSIIQREENIVNRPLIVEMNVTDNFPPCLNKEEINSYKHENCQIERKNYINECKSHIIIGEKNISVDERAHSIQTIKKIEFYEKCAYNMIMFDCLKTEKNYNDINTTLFIRNYFGIEKKCLDYYSNQTISNLEMEKVKKSYNSSISSYMIYLVFSIFNSILIITHWIISLMKNQSLINKLENQIWSLILLFGFFSSFIIMTFFFETKFIFSLYREGCFDEINEYIFKNAQSIVQSWKNKDLFLFLSGLIVGIGCIIRERLTKDQTFEEYVEYRKPEELEDLEGEDGFTDDSTINN